MVETIIIKAIHFMVKHKQLLQIIGHVHLTSNKKTMINAISWGRSSSAFCFCGLFARGGRQREVTCGRQRPGLGWPQLAAEWKQASFWRHHVSPRATDLPTMELTPPRSCLSRRIITASCCPPLQAFVNPADDWGVAGGSSAVGEEVGGDWARRTAFPHHHHHHQHQQSSLPPTTSDATSTGTTRLDWRQLIHQLRGNSSQTWIRDVPVY